MNDETGSGRIVVASVRDEVYRILRERILHFAYPPGARLRLQELETALGVSRTPLREALQRLESEGLVDVRPRRGTFVMAVDPDEIRESYEMRAILESGAADIVVRTITDAEIAELERLHLAMGERLRSGDYQAIVSRFIELDRELHGLMIRFTRHRLLIAHHGEVDTLLYVARLRRRFDLPDSLRTQEEHAAIVEALGRRRPGALRKAILRHIEGAVRRTMAALPDRDPAGSSIPAARRSRGEPG